MSKEIVKKGDLKAALGDVRGRGELTTAAYRTAISAFIESGHPATVEGFASYVDGLRSTRAASTINQLLAAGMAAFLQAADRLGLPAKEKSIIRGALSEIPRVAIAPPEVEVVSATERQALLAALPERIALIVETLYQTGARVSEITDLRREAVKLNGFANLRLLGKGAKERTRKITLELYDRIIKVFGESGDFLFTTEYGNAFKRQYVTREISRAARRALGRSISAHTLRHSRATDLIAETGKVKGTSRFLGHASEATTLRYYVKENLTEDELFGNGK